MECKQCRQTIETAGYMTRRVQYEDGVLQSAPDGGSLCSTADAGVFCCDGCLLDYIAAKVERAADAAAQAIEAEKH